MNDHAQGRFMTDTSRPNILLIMTDQQSANMMSCAGNTDLRTPNMDALAARGVRFERAYCTQPICVPSRVSMLTGRMPHETGVGYNMDTHDILAPCVGRLLTDSGYDCGYVGKWHVPVSIQDRQWHGFGTMAATEGHGTDPEVPEACARFLVERRDRPFFFVASFHNPHDICQWARGEPLPNGSLPEPPEPEACPPLPVNFEPPDGEPEVIRELQRAHWRTYPSIDFGPDDWRRYRWAYVRLVERVDAQVGEVLSALEASGQTQPTMIIFLSDHGDGNAAHRWNQKSLLYEELVRVPFIVCQPKGTCAAVNRKALVSTGLDLLPTLCDYAGIEAPQDLHGCSIRAQVEAPDGASAHSVIVAQTNLAPLYGVDGGTYGRMIRNDRYKYIVYSRGRRREQLFDLQTDPDEMRDLSEVSAQAETLQSLRYELATRGRRTSDPFVVPGVEQDGYRLIRSA